MDSYIDREIRAELDRSSNFTSRGTIKLRVLFNLADKMKISRDSIYETKDLVYVNPSVSRAFESLWHGFSLVKEQEDDDYDRVDHPSVDRFTHAAGRERQKNEISKEERETFEMFLSRDFCKPCDVTKATTALRKRMCLLLPDSSPVASQKCKRNLWCIFGADGLLSDTEDDLTPYYSNLSFPVAFGERNDFSCEDGDPDCSGGGGGAASSSSDAAERGVEARRRMECPAETHARTVRTLYREVRYATPQRIGSVLTRWLKLEGEDNKPNPPSDAAAVSNDASRTIEKHDTEEEDENENEDNVDNDNVSSSSGGSGRRRSRRRRNSSGSSSDGSGGGSSSSSSSGGSEYTLGSDDYIIDCYRRYVGSRLGVVANFLKQRARARKIEAAQRKEKDAQKKRKRTPSKATVGKKSDGHGPVKKTVVQQQQQDERVEKKSGTNVGSEGNEIRVSEVGAVASSPAKVISEKNSEMSRNKKRKKDKDTSFKSSKKVFKNLGNTVKYAIVGKKTSTDEVAKTDE